MARLEAKEEVKSIEIKLGSIELGAIANKINTGDKDPAVGAGGKDLSETKSTGTDLQADLYSPSEIVGWLGDKYSVNIQVLFYLRGPI